MSKLLVRRDCGIATSATTTLLCSFIILLTTGCGARMANHPIGSNPWLDGNPGQFAGYYTWLDSSGKKLALSPTNPVALLNLSDDESTVNRIISNIKIDYDLPLDGLVATVNAGYDHSKGDGFSSVDKNMPTDSAGFDGSKNDYLNETTNLLFDA